MVLEENVTPWGHITSCGSVANIEALWAARNMKLHPIALKNALKNDQRLKPAADSLCVTVPCLKRKIKFVDAESWDLLNLDVDEVCGLSSTVASLCDIPMEALTTILEDYNYTSIGIADFLSQNQIKNPVFLTPPTSHYSWPKAANLLGLGSNNLIHVPVDSHGRLNVVGKQNNYY